MLKKFLRQSAGYGVVEAARHGVGLLLLPVYARILAPADYGVVAVLAVTQTLLEAAFSCGIGSAVIRYLFVHQEPREQRMFLTSATAILLGGGLAVSFLLTGWGAPLFRALFPSIPPYPFLPLVVWSAFWSLAELIPMALLLARQRVRAYTLL